MLADGAAPLAPSPCSSCAPLSPSQLQVGSRRARYPRGRLAFVGWARPAPSRRHSSARILQSSDLSISLLPKTGRSEQPRSGHHAGRQCVRRPGVPTKEGKSVLHRRPRTSRVLEQSYICKSATTVIGAVRAFQSHDVWCATFFKSNLCVPEWLSSPPAWQNHTRRDPLWRNPTSLSKAWHSNIEVSYPHCNMTYKYKVNEALRRLRSPTNSCAVAPFSGGLKRTVCPSGNSGA